MFACGVCPCFGARVCLCVGVCTGATGRTKHTRPQMHTATDLDTRAWAYMMTDLALLAWPPQVPLSVRQSAEQPAGGGLQRAVEPRVSRGREGGWSQREKGKGRGEHIHPHALTHAHTHTQTDALTHSHAHTHMCARGAEGRQCFRMLLPVLPAPPGASLTHRARVCICGTS